MSLSAALCLYVSAQAAAGGASFADVWDRWRAVDAAWTLTSDPVKKSAALPPLKVANGLIFAARWGEACQHLDATLAALEGRKPTPDQAAILRFRPPVAEPGKPARLEVGWAYRPADADPLKLKVGNREVLLHPGRALTLEVLPERLEPELARTPELGVPIAAQIGNATRTVYLSIVKSARARVERLAKSADPTVQALAQRAAVLMRPESVPDPSLSLLSLMGLAESLAGKELTLSGAELIPYARQGQTGLRIALPKGSTGGLTVVIGVSGFGGEGAFFDNFAQGAAPAEALKRGWAFVGTTATETCVADALRWIDTRLQRKVTRYVTIGYGRAAGEAATGAVLPVRHSAIALLAPASTAIPQSWAKGPMFFAVGKEEASRIRLPVNSIVRELDRPDAVLEEFDGIEHLMLPAVALKSTFEFFDRFLR